MKKILISVFLFCGLFARSQTYMNEIKAKNNSNAIGNIGRVDVNLKVLDSAVLAKLNASVAVTGTFWQATQPVSGTVSITANSAVNIAQINGVTPLMGNGVTGTGSQRVTIASDNTAFTVNAAQSGTWNLTNISGTISLPTGASTSANQSTEITSLQLIDDIVHSGDATLSKYSVSGGVFDDVSPVAVTENNAQSFRMSSRRALYVETPSSGTFAVTSMPTVSITANSSVNVAQINGVTPLMGNGVTGTGSQRVTIASDNTAFTVNAAQSGAWNITNVSGTVSLPTGASTLSEQQTQTTALQLIDNIPNTLGSTTSGQSGVLGLGAVTTAAPTYTTAQSNALSLQTDGSLRTAVTNTVTVSATNLSTNVAQINGVTPLMGNGVTGTGSPRVTIASDGTAISTTGYMSVKLDQTTPGTTNGVSLVPTTTGGLTTFHLVSAASTNATSVKASAGQLYGYYIFNANAAARKIAFHNTSGTPTAGASVFFSIVIPASSGANVEFSQGIAFSSGIGITTVTGTADSDATGVASGDLIINLLYK